MGKCYSLSQSNVTKSILKDEKFPKMKNSNNKNDSSFNLRELIFSEKLSKINFLSRKTGFR